MERSEKRPGGITLLMVIGVIQGLLGILAGVVLFIGRTDQQVLAQSGNSKSAVAAVAITTMAFGALVVLISLALGGGSRGARLVLGIVVILDLIGDVYVIFKYTGSQRTGAIVAAVVALIVLYLLYGSQASKDFFARS
jgi:hypothetical protein